MPILALVRRDARRRLRPAALDAAAAALGPGLDPGSWRDAEQALAGEMTASPRAARRLVESFAAVARAHGASEAVGRAARLRGSLEAYLGRYAASLPHYHRAAEALRGPARDGARLGLAESYHRLGRQDESVRMCRAVRSAARRRGDALLAAGADLAEAVAVHEAGRPKAALRLYERAAAAFADAGLGRLAATARQNAGNALVLLDRYAEAEEHLGAAQQTLDELGLAHDAARCLYNRGALLAVTDRLGDADAALREAERRLRAAGDAPTAALCRLDRGEVLYLAGLLPEARHAVSSARRALGRSVPVVERERARLLLARIEIAAGRGRAAAALLRPAAPRGHGRLEAERIELQGRARALGGRYAYARAALGDAAARHGRAGRPGARARCLVADAWCALRMGDLAAARRRTRAAARSAQELSLPGLQHAAAAVSFLTESDAGRRREAGAALDRALSALERVRDGLGPDALRSAAMRGREAWFARAVRHVLDGRDGPQRALALVERWRARALVDLLGDAERIAPADAAGDAETARLRARVASLERRLEARESPAFLRAAGTDSTAAVARSLRSAERRLRDALGREGAAHAPPVDLQRLWRRVPSGTVLLSLFADEHGSLLFTLDRRGVHVVEGPGDESRVAHLVDELRFHLGQFELGGEFVARHAARLARRTDAVLAELARHTLEPVADELARARRVVVVPHGAWHHVPFAALPLGGRRLVERMDVALTPALGALEHRVRPARGAPVVLAVADESAPTVSEEGRRVAATLPRGRLFAGEDATAQALRGMAAPSCLHVAAHGRYRADAPALSGVRLADGWLRACDFLRLPLRGSTVVLSGCETGVSAVDAGDEVHGLVRGVLAGGAAELVASLWRVDDPATAALMQELHALRAAGASAEAALGRVQARMAANGVHPYYWAGFSLWTRRVVSP